jgi:hypothetical protein
MSDVPIEFGTDGWRAVIADDYTFVNLERVAQATAAWLHDDYGDSPSVVLGYDLRFLGRQFAERAAEVLAEEHDYDTGVIEQAATFARADLDDGETASPFVTLLFDFTRTPTQRPIIAQRLSEHTQKRAQRADDVAGLFDA